MIGLAVVGGGMLALVGLWAARHDGAGVPPAGAPNPAAHRAVIVDQLDLTAPGASFVAAARKTLTSAGFSVDVVPAREATVEGLRELPQRRPEVLVLRMHAARIAAGDRVTDDVALFTGEPVDLAAMPMVGLPPVLATAVAAERAAHPASARPADRAGAARFSADELRALVPMVYAVDGRSMPYIGLRPSYVADRLDGRFDGRTIVILMGCDSLRAPAMAEAFRAAGAGGVVGWNGPVTADHTDAATLALLSRLAPGAALTDVVAAVNAQIGPDPGSGAAMVAIVN